MLKYPTVKLVIPFVLGIVISFVWAPDPLYLLVTLLIIFPVVITCYYIKKNIWQKVFKTSLYLILIVYGAAYHSFTLLNKSEYPFLRTKYKNTVLYGTVKEVDLINNNYYRFVLSSDSMRVGNDSRAISYDFMVRVFFNDSLYSGYSQLGIGNKLELEATVKKGRIQRNPGEFSYQEYLENENIVALADVYKPESIKIRDDRVDYFDNAVFSIRKIIEEVIRQNHNNETAALLRGLLLADRSMIDPDLRESYVNAGVVHVLAVSGLHVGYIILIFLVIFNRASIVYRYIFTIIGLLFFLVITGMPPSVFRATIMAIILLLSGLSSRSYDPVNSLFLAGLILLLLNPAELFNPGFQLSFSAVFSILVVFPVIKKFIINHFSHNKYIQGILLFLGVTLSAQLGTLPFTLYYFGKLPLLSFLSNLIVIPIIGIIVANGILSILLSFLSSFLVIIYSGANELLVLLLNGIIETLGSIDFAFVYIPEFTVYDSILFYTLIIALFIFFNLGQGKWYRLIVTVLLLSVFLLFEKIDDKELLTEGKLSLMMIDVGQGESFLLKFPNGKIMLIDGGDANQYFDNGKRTVIPLLRKLGIDRVNYGVISHLDADHLNGFIEILRRVPIDTLYKPLDRSGERKDKVLEKYLKEKNIPFRYFHREKLDIGSVRVYFLNDTSDQDYDTYDINNRSGLIKIIHNNNSFLFTGDAEGEVEEWLIKRYGQFLNASVLKCGHHGSKTSTTEEFLGRVNPELALISAGLDNRFNHPSKTVLDKLKEKNIFTLRSDKLGAVILESEGRTLKFVNWKD